MTLSFAAPTPAPDLWSAYLDWVQHLRDATGLTRLAPGDALTPLYYPVFVTANDADMATPAFFDALEAFPQVRFDPMEREVAARLRGAGGPVETMVYLPVEDAIVPTRLYTPVHVGAAVALVDRPAPAAAAHDPAPAAGGKVALGVIDDGVPYLHARMRTPAGQTRVEAIWLQRLATGASPSHVDTGVVLSRGDIQRMVDQVGTAPETAAYAAQNRVVYPDLPTMTVERAASHGGHTLDLAGGAAPEGTDPLHDVPVLAVQLPPEAVDDTSGTRMDSYVVQGLRWLIYCALKRGFGHLVVNASLGVVAGPKDGTRFVEQQVALEIDRAAGQGLTVEVVLPMGNDHDSRLVAQADLAAGAEMALDLLLPRDDRTPSYVEFRARDAAQDGALAGLHLALTAPDGAMAAMAAVPPPGAWAGVLHKGVEVGRLYHMAARALPGGRDPERPHLVLAFAPSAPLVKHGTAGRPRLVSSGTWQIALQAQEPLALAVMVQRDDSAVGYPQIGRQAILDAPMAYRWAPSVAGGAARPRSYTALAPGGPIVHEATHNAFATRVHPNIHVAAEGHAIAQATESFAPTAQSARGTAWSTRTGPTATALVATSDVFFGVRAAGTVSGSSARFSGTSSAAAIVTRSRVLALVGAPGDSLQGPANLVSRYSGRVTREFVTN